MGDEDKPAQGLKPFKSFQPNARNIIHYVDRDSAFWKQLLRDALELESSLTPPIQPSEGRKPIIDATKKLNEKKGVTVPQAAEFLKVNRRTISRLVSHHRLTKLPGNRGISVESLIKYARESAKIAQDDDDLENLLGHLGQ